MWMPDRLMELVRVGDEAHACGVAVLARESAPGLGMDGGEAYLAGLLHDVGKLVIPLEILDARRDLTPEEFLVVKRHPQEGARLVTSLWPGVPTRVLGAVRHHHERRGGFGYPDGLLELDEFTALIAACDVLDALRRDRCYRPAFSLVDAFRTLRGEALPERVVDGVVATASRLARPA